MSRLRTLALLATILFLAQLALPGAAQAAPITPPGVSFYHLATEVVRITTAEGTRAPGWLRLVYSLYPRSEGWFVNGLPYRAGGVWFVRMSRWARLMEVPLVTEEGLCRASYQGVWIWQIPPRCRGYFWH